MRLPRILLGILVAATLPHVDSWNTWFADTRNTVEEFAALNARISEAAEQAGRDPATLERSVCVYVQLEGRPERDAGPDPITGTPEEIHATLREFARAGADEVILVVSPITEASIRLTAGPLNTGCVQYATTRTAPCSFNARAASQSVLAVSTMSSMITHVLPFTSPMMFITLATFGRGRRLSMIARSLSSRFAIARARTTPPTSGDTTTWFLYPILKRSPRRIGVA